MLGYELTTEGIAFDLNPALWTQAPHRDAQPELPVRAFMTFARLELQSLGVNPFDGDKLLLALLSVWGQQDRRAPAAAAHQMELGGWREAIVQEVQFTYRLKPDAQQAAVAIFDREDVRVALASAWKKAMTPPEQDFKDWVWDVRVLSLAQAFLLAAQNMAGVEVGQQLAVKAPLRQDEGRSATPSLFLFEDGIGGLGVARSLHEQFKSRPLAFWDAAEHQLNHCPVGDEEDLLLGLLACPERTFRVWPKSPTAHREAETAKAHRG